MNSLVDETSAEVEAVRAVIDREQDYSLWAFEDVPATGVTPDQAWTIGVTSSDFVVVLIGLEVTDAVEREVDLALKLNKWILAFVRSLPAGRGARATAMIEKLRQSRVYRTFTTPDELAAALTESLRNDTRLLTRQGVCSIRCDGLTPPPWRVTASGTVTEDSSSADIAYVIGAEHREVNLLVARARDHLVRGRFSQALTEYKELRANKSLTSTPDTLSRVLNNLSLAARWLERSDVALESSRAAVEADPASDRARVTHLANLVAFRAEDWNSRIEASQEFLSSRADGLQLLAAIAVDEGRFESAIALAKGVIERDAEEYGARLVLGHSLAKVERYDDGLRVLSEIPPSSAAIYISAQVRRAEILYERARRTPSADRLLLEAESALGNAEQLVQGNGLSIEDWKEAHLHSVVCRAGLNIVRGRGMEAVGMLREVEGEILDRRTFLMNIAQAYTSCGRSDEAVVSLEEAVSLAPEDHDATIWLAAVLVNRFNISRKREDLTRAEELLVELLRNEAVGLAVLNLTQILVGADRLNDASALVARATRALPYDLEVSVASLVVAIRQSDRSMVLRIAREINARDSREVMSGTILGIEDHQQDRYAEAVLKLRDATADKFCSTIVHVETYTYLARALRRLGRREEAIEAAIEGSRRYPSVGELSALCEELVNKGSE